MIALTCGLVDPAAEAGIELPPDELIKNDSIDKFKESHLRFWLFCRVQLGSVMPTPDAHWKNAEVIASLSDDELRTITLEQLIAKGLCV